MQQQSMSRYLTAPFTMVHGTRMSRFIVSLSLVVLMQQSAVMAVRNLRIASPLQSFTIWDTEAKEEQATPRSRFLPKFKAGLEAEAKARKVIAEKRDQKLQADATSSDWAKQAASTARRMSASDEKMAEEAFDKAVSQVGQSKKLKKRRATNPNQYQFVGVVNPASDGTPISWYAREKPRDSKWSVRLVHANRDAIVKDLYNRGRVDVFAKYENTGLKDEETKSPIITSKYSVKARSWKTLWNFSPKHVFSDSSGMYWRERRLRPGMYTDGSMVYESSYRYRDGRNGMHRLSSFDKYLSSKAIDQSQKAKILQRLKQDAPDVVLEE